MLLKSYRREKNSSLVSVASNHGPRVTLAYADLVVTPGLGPGRLETSAYFLFLLSKSQDSSGAPFKTHTGVIRVWNGSYGFIIPHGSHMVPGWDLQDQLKPAQTMRRFLKIQRAQMASSWLVELVWISIVYGSHVKVKCTHGVCIWKGAPYPSPHPTPTPPNPHPYSHSKEKERKRKPCPFSSSSSPPPPHTNFVIVWISS